jgi:Protein of unknown function (DUF3179)
MTRRAKHVAVGAIALLIVAVVVVPLAIDQPFGQQTARRISIAFTLRRWAPSVTLAAFASLAAFAIALWRGARAAGRTFLLAASIVGAAGAWVAWQNPFEWMFNPLRDIRFEPAASASFVDDRDLVIAVSTDGDRAAYPIRQLAYHHVVNDRIGGSPAVVTY